MQCFQVFHLTDNTQYSLEPRGAHSQDSFEDDISDLTFNNYDADDEELDDDSSFDNDYTSQFHENLIFENSDDLNDDLDEDGDDDEDDDTNELINLPFVSRHRASSIQTISAALSVLCGSIVHSNVSVAAADCSHRTVI